MNRPSQSNSKTEHGSLAAMFSLLAMALIGGVMATSLLITGDSVTVSSGETLPQNLLIFVAALAAGLAGWRLLPTGRPIRFPAILLLVAVLSLLVSCIAASLRADGRAVWNNFWHVISLLLFTLMAARAAERPALSRAFLQMVMVCAVFQSTFAMHQYFVSMPAARAEYLADPDASIMKAQIDAPPGSELRSQYESRLLGSFEPPGTFALTNSLAVLLSGAIVALGVICLRRTGNGGIALWSLRIVLLLIVCVWLLTKSRSGYLAVFLVAGFAIAIAQFSRWRWHLSAANTREFPSTSNTRWVIAAVVACLMLGLAIALLSSDRLVLSEAPKSILYRLEYWQATAKMIVDYPLTGVGLGNFQSYYPAYKLPAASEVIADPHNWLFDLAVNCSLPFLMTVVLALAWALREGFRKLRTAELTQGETETRTNDRAIDRSWVQAFWVGALIIFFVTGGLQLVLGELIDFDATALGAVAAALCWWTMRALPVALCTVRRCALLAVITMLVCLLASGSWQASGIALPMGLWLAICNPAEQNADASTLERRGAGALVSLAMVVIVLGAFIWQTWQPVQSCWALEQQAIAAWQQGQPQQAISLVQQASAADSLASSPRRLLVQFHMDQAIAAGRRAAASDFAQAAAQVHTSLTELLNDDPVSNLNHAYAGECHLAMAASTVSWNRETSSEQVHFAAEHYGQAVKRYPTSVALRAQLAVVQAWLDLHPPSQPDALARENREGLSATATEQLNEAFRLSELTPHTNRKLASQQVFLPAPLADRFASEAVVRFSPDSPWAKAEPLCEFLRKL